MTSPDQERVTCPKCGKGYRWQPTMVGKSLPCKQCGTTFEIPAQPGQGLLPQPADDDGLYELADTPNDKPEQPPAFVPPPAPPAQEPDPSAYRQAAELAIDEATGDAGSADDGEPQVHVSEAAKAARREEQRIAAAEAEAQGSWRDYKWLIIVLSVLALLGVIYWGMHLFSNAMDKGLHNTMLLDDHFAPALSDPSHLIETS